MDEKLREGKLFVVCDGNGNWRHAGQILLFSIYYTT